MPKRTAATLGGVIAAILLIAGIAWASGADDSPSDSTAPSASTSLDENGSLTSAGNLSTSTSVNGETSTSVGDSTSSSSANSSTSTTIDDNTSSTVDDIDDRDDNSGPGGDDDDRDDNSGPGGGDDDRDDNSGPGGGHDDAVAIADGIHTFDVAGVARVTINVASGTLQLIEVEANAGWTADIDEARADRIKVKFRNGEAEAEFEAKLEHGGLEVESKPEADLS